MNENNKESILTLQEDMEPVKKLAKYDNGEVSAISSHKNDNNHGQQNENNTTVSLSKLSSQKNDIVKVQPCFDSRRPIGVEISSAQKKYNKDDYIHASLFTSTYQEAVRKSFKDSTDFFDDETGVELCCSPFRHCVLPNFVTDSDYIAELEAELLGLPLKEKNNDLYKFRQSEELNKSKLPAVSLFRSLCDDLKLFLTNVTDIPLNSKVDLFCSQYQYTDVLLCHDDELEERRIAFIYYLVPEKWSVSDGGTLDLFDSDALGQPKNITKSIVPKRNSFLFFEVSAASFHQGVPFIWFWRKKPFSDTIIKCWALKKVAEVLSEDMTRLSISGWFHGPPLPRPPAHTDTLPPAVPYGSVEEEVFYAWINPLYLAPEIQTDIKLRFEEDSEIELTDFLQEEKYIALTAAMQQESIDWTLLGPANKRNYYSANVNKLPDIVSEFLRVIHSDAAFLVLSNLTGLKLHPMAPSDDDSAATSSGDSGEPSTSTAAGIPRCRSDVRKWEHGCYTLAHDTDSEIQDFALDTIMYIGCDNEWSFENGGYTSYIARGEEDELLSVCPSGNSLALVYRDKDTMRFVKHLNNRVSKLSPPRFFDISTVYRE